MKIQLSNSPTKFIVQLSMLALVAIATVACDEDTQQQTDAGQQTHEQRIDERYYQSEPEPEPVQTIKPIDPFYGGCHSNDCQK